MDDVAPREGDALLVVDLQNDFLPGGALGVTEGDAVVRPLNRAIRAFSDAGLPVVATRDWHPPGHCSFTTEGGPWPVHCVAGTEGAAFAPALKLPPSTVVVSKAVTADAEAYSGFAGTDLAERLSAADVRRVVVGGLATDYCVLNTVLDALEAGFGALVLEDAVRAVDVEPGDGTRALDRMRTAGAEVASTQTALTGD